MSAPTMETESLPPFSDIGTAEEAAYLYYGAGLCPIPTKFKSKAPQIEWKGITLDPSSFHKQFSPPCNIQIQMGSAFGGFVDVDLDTPAARNLATVFLPKSACKFGRNSSPASTDNDILWLCL